MNENFFFYFYQLFLKHWIQLIQSYNYAFQSMSSSQCAYVDSSEERIAIEWLNHSAQWISSISIIESNLDIIQLFLNHWIQLIQSYNHVFQSISSNQRAYVDSNRERVTIRWAIDHSEHWTFSISISESNLNIFQVFWKRWIQLNKSYHYVSQSMSDSQCAYVDSSEERWWQTKIRSISVLNLRNLIYWVKSWHYSIILKAINSANSELQLCLSK